MIEVHKAIRLENTKAPHNKFYEIAVLSDDLAPYNCRYKVFTRWGKIPNDKGHGGYIAHRGNMLITSINKAEKILREKTRKGYEIVHEYNPPIGTSIVWGRAGFTRAGFTRAGFTVRDFISLREGKQGNYLTNNPSPAPKKKPKKRKDIKAWDSNPWDMLL